MQRAPLPGESPIWVLSMPVSADTLRLQLDYSAWATRRLLDDAAELTAAERSRDFGTADRSVAGTLLHIFAADRIWLTRVLGMGQPSHPGADFEEINTLREAWLSLGAEWKAWAETLSDAGALQVLSYCDLKGNPWQTPLWQIVLHVVNHATHHRGQVAGFLRTLGRKPPTLDLITYYRQMS